MAAHATGPGSPPRDELVTKVLVAVRVPGVDAHEVIQAHRRQVVELMQQWTRVKEEQAEFDLPFALVVDAELTRLAAVVRWLDLADGHVRRAATEPGAGGRPEAAAQGGGPAMSVARERGPGPRPAPGVASRRPAARESGRWCAAPTREAVI